MLLGELPRPRLISARSAMTFSSATSAMEPSTRSIRPPGSSQVEVKNGGGNAIVNSGLHALTFRPDGFGDRNTLYFTAGINNGQDGLFGAITTGLVSATTGFRSPYARQHSFPITVTVSAGPGNPGNPTGTLVFQADDVLGSDGW